MKSPEQEVLSLVERDLNSLMLMSPGWMLLERSFNIRSEYTAMVLSDQRFVEAFVTAKLVATTPHQEFPKINPEPRLLDWIGALLWLRPLAT